MKISEILSLPNGVKEIDSIDAIIGFVNKVEHKQGTAKTGKNIGKPYSFYCQNIQLSDGEETIYWNGTFKNEADTVKAEDRGKRIRILECVVDKYMSKKDEKEHKVLKGGFIDNIGEESRAEIPQEVKTIALKAKEEEIKAHILAGIPAKIVDNTPISVVKNTDWDKKNRIDIRAKAYTTCVITMFPILMEKLRTPEGALPDNKDIVAYLDYFAEEIYNFAIKEPLADAVNENKDDIEISF